MLLTWDWISLNKCLKWCFNLPLCWQTVSDLDNLKTQQPSLGGFTPLLYSLTSWCTEQLLHLPRLTQQTILAAQNIIHILINSPNHNRTLKMKTWEDWATRKCRSSFLFALALKYLLRHYSAQKACFDLCTSYPSKWLFLFTKVLLLMFDL